MSSAAQVPEPVRPLWPQVEQPTDEELLAGERDGPVLDRWQYTVNCFLVPVTTTRPSDDRLSAHGSIRRLVASRIIVHAAFMWRCAACIDCPSRSLWPSYSEVLCAELTRYLKTTIPVHLKESIEPGPVLDAILDPSIAPIPRLLLHMYRGGDPSVDHNDGYFDDGQLAILLAMTAGAVRVAHGRAETRLRALVEKYKGEQET